MGIGGNIEMWRPFRSAFQGMTTIAYDAPGTGESPTPPRPMRIPALARIACAILDRLGLDRVDVLVYSFGGAVAQQLAVAFPARVRRLVLGATNCGLGSLPGNPLALSLIATPLRYYSERHLRWMLPIAMGGRSGRDPAVWIEQARLRTARPPSLVGSLWQLAAITGWSSLGWLHRVHHPTLVLAGERDPLNPLANARLLQRRLGDAQVHVVPGGGHLFLLDQPADVVGVVGRFLVDERPAS